MILILKKPRPLPRTKRRDDLDLITLSIIKEAHILTSKQYAMVERAVNNLRKQRHYHRQYKQNNKAK